MVTVPERKLALYIHWPFCVSKCPYCDFNSHVVSDVNHELWLKAYLQELENYRELLAKAKVNSIFFGGGTPSLMPTSLVSQIIEKINSISPLAPNIEITLEVNPTSVEANKLKQFAVAGINRISIGVQSLHERALEFLGRNHSVEQALMTIDLAAKHFKAYSIDLIYARPKQTLQDWEQELKQAISLANGHLSLYQLTIEKGTPFYLLHKNRSFTLPEDELAASMYNLTRDIASSFGYAQYEISNYAYPGSESKHNLAYWLYDEYLGIGPGAHSRISKENVAHALSMYYQPQKWLQQVLEHGTGLQHDYALKLEEVTTEIIMMGLRINQGIDDSKLQKYLAKTFTEVLNLEKLSLLQQLGLIVFEGETLRITTEGLILHNSIVIQLLP